MFDVENMITMKKMLKTSSESLGLFLRVINFNYVA